MSPRPVSGNPELDFVQSPVGRCGFGRVSGRVAEGGQERCGRGLGEFPDVGGGRGQGKRQGLPPEDVADAGQDIGEGGDGLGIPGGPAGTEGTRPVQAVGDQDEPAERPSRTGVVRAMAAADHWR